MKKLNHIIAGWYYGFTGKNYELGQSRLKFCKDCEHHKQITKRIWVCQECGCVTSKKTLVKGESCPQGKW